MRPLNLVARTNCLLGRHRRSRSLAVRYADNSVLSSCRHCGIAMYRHPREGWQVERRAEQRCFEKAKPRLDSSSVSNLHPDD